MLGGARIVRFVVLQESRITASAAVPPTPHRILSRLPWIHRVSLDCHTNTKCCQRIKNSTTHFYGKNSDVSRRRGLFTYARSTKWGCPFGFGDALSEAGASSNSVSDPFRSFRSTMGSRLPPFDLLPAGEHNPRRLKRTFHRQCSAFANQS